MRKSANRRNFYTIRTVSEGQRKTSNMIKIFFDSRQSVSENDSFSPSAQKPAQVAESWRNLGIPVEFSSYIPSTIKQIKLVHKDAYVDGVFKGTHVNGFGNKSNQVAAALPWVCGSMVAAALYAFENKINTFSPTSGAHHAGYERGGGFCTFNFLMLAAVLVHQAGAQRVGIVDCDMHFGDGTENIIRKIGIDYVQHSSFARSDFSGTDDGQNFIDHFPDELQKFSNCDIILYNAGADPHINDPLGGVLTTDQLRSRDFLLFLCMKKLGIPVATSLAGGYQRDENGSINPVLEIHDNTLRECHRVLTEY